MDYQAIDWRVNYAAVWRPLSKPQADAWEMFLQKNLRNGIRAAELDQAVASMCATWKKETHPQVKDIFWHIIAMRRGTAPGGDRRVNVIHVIHPKDGDYRTHTEIEEVPIGELKRAIRDAKPEDRWTYVCAPSEAKDCMELEKYALSLPGGVVRPKLSMQPIVDALKKMPTIESDEEVMAQAKEKAKKDVQTIIQLDTSC